MKNRDENLIKECLKGTAKSQKALYDQYKVMAYMVCLRYAASQQEAQDFLQDGFIKVFRDLHQVDLEKGSLKAWIRKVILNTALQNVRSKKNIFSSIDIDLVSNLHVVDEDVTSNLSTQELTQLIQTLPEGYRVVFNLYVIEGYTHKEIGNMLNISDSTSKSQLFKAKALLRKKLKVTNPAVSEKYGKKIQQRQI